METGNFQIDGLVQQRQELEKLLMSNPAMEKKVQGLIRKVLLQARKVIGDRAKSDIKADPRQAYKAVKTSVYRQILGGNISILNKRRAGKRMAPPPVVHQLETRTNSKGNHRGGNRIPRSRRTEDLLTYYGADRAFILRFINSGTQQRTSHGGNRGLIAPRNFFSTSSHTAMQKAAEQLSILIDDMIKKELK